MGFIPQHKSTKKSDLPLLKQIIDLVPKHIMMLLINFSQIKAVQHTRYMINLFQ